MGDGDTELGVGVLSEGDIVKKEKHEWVSPLDGWMLGLKGGSARGCKGDWKVKWKFGNPGAQKPGKSWVAGVMQARAQCTPPSLHLLNLSCSSPDMVC